MFRTTSSFFLISLLALVRAHAAPDAPTMERGAKLYLERCSMCHQPTGQGVPAVFPPLAGSDWLADRERTIKALCEGLEGPITVSGKSFGGVMPPQMLDDAQVADVLTYVAASWGNQHAAFSPAEVAAVRKKTKFATFDDLKAASAFRPLPQPPAGLTVREAAQCPEFFTRLATDGAGRVFGLGLGGAVYAMDAKAGAFTPVFRGESYIDPKNGPIQALGIALDPQQRLWITTNQTIGKPDGERWIQSEVTIWRTGPIAPGTLEGTGEKPTVWFRVRYPQGIGPFNHGVGHIAFGPDGMLYIGSGSRTDGGEPGDGKEMSTEGETPITACIWRLDPKADKPQIEVIARGLRNPYGFAWDNQQRLFTVTNGPNANEPEEMDEIIPGGHYGFPFQFGNTPAKTGSPYPHTPAAPDGTKFTLPVHNLGPSGTTKTTGDYTFDPHSCPGGALWCGDDFPAPLRGGFLVTRFGNLIGAPNCPKDVGFDLLLMHLRKKNTGEWVARTDTILAPLGRPIDAVRHLPGRALILEYTRSTDSSKGEAWLPGRVLELSAAGQ